MSKPLVVFGSGDIAQLAHYYFTRDTTRQLVAFTVDQAYITAPEFCGLPVVPFEELAERYPPAEYDLFIALSYAKLNAVRKEKYLAAKAMGYHLASYVSSHATVLNDGRIGENCFILEDNTIQPFVTIGHNVTLWSGNHIGHHSTIQDHCFLASHIVVSGGVVVEEQCFIGVNVTLRDHVTIGARSILGAGTLILGDTAPESVYVGTRSVASERKSSEQKKI